MFAPFRSFLFLLLVAAVLVFGRMAIDLVWTGSDPLRVQRAQYGHVIVLANANTLPSLWGSPAERGQRWARAAYEWLYIRTGVHRVLLIDPEALSGPEQAVRRGADTLVARPHWQAAMLGTQTLAARAAMLPSAAPTLALAYLLALLDGLVARSVRRAGAGRESATRYHRAKYTHVSLLTLILLVWFWWPEPLDLTTLTLTAAVFGAILLRIQLKFYKKYL